MMMEFEMQPYGVYIQTDDEGRITAINSDAFLRSLDGWTKIDEGYGDKYHHAQGNYLPGPLMDERGIYRYKLVNGKVVPRTQEEIDADYIPPEEKPDIDNDLAAQVAALQKQVNEQAATIASYESAYMEGVQQA
jgi:hypothetical protein